MMGNPIKYGNNLLDITYGSPVVTLSSDKQMGQILQSYPGAVRTTYGNGFRFGSGGAQVLACPIAGLSSSYYPVSSPKGSIAADTSRTDLASTGTSDIWIKTDTGATKWTPQRKIYYVYDYPVTGGTITNNTVTFIDCSSAPSDIFKNNWGSSYGEQNAGVGSKTTYTQGYYIVVPFDGLYLINFSLGINQAGTAQFNFYTSIYVDGTEVQRGWDANFLVGTAGIKVSQVTTIKYLTKDQKVSFAALQNSGASRTIQADEYNNNCIVNIGG